MSKISRKVLWYQIGQLYLQCSHDYKQLSSYAMEMATSAHSDRFDRLGTIIATNSKARRLNLQK